MSIGRATYSPDDNKIRIYPTDRLPADIYARVNAAGFKWAPKQKLFVAPMWTPQRADLAEELCGDLEDEDTSLVERAEERAERFDEYSDKRASEARSAREAVAEISGGIELGQPILIGHHSQRKAEKDAEKIENGMRKALKLWETSEYWTSRAAGALAHAKYKELPTVRARRIKTIEADKRKAQRDKDEAAKWLKLWTECGQLAGDQQHQRAVEIAGFCWLHMPRKEGDRPDFDQRPTAHSVLTNAYPSLYAPRTADEVVAHAIKVYPRTIAWQDRWIEHYNNRLAYEQAMLDEQGASHLLAKKERPKQLPICNYMAADGLEIENPWRRGEFNRYPMVVMTKAEYSALHSDYRGTRVVGNSHRVKVAMIRRDGDRHAKLYTVFLSDSKTHEPPAAVEREPMPAPGPRMEYVPPVKSADEQEFSAMRQQLKAGVQVVSAPQLFPTPAAIAEYMVELAEIERGMLVLEPSAGTGNLLQSIMADDKAAGVTAVEINQQLAQRLSAEYPLTVVHCMDFLEYSRGNWPVDRIVMNPPFENGADIKHIQHAMTMLKPGGKLVALCANGPRQQAAIKPLVDYWEDLPPGSFAASGTMVNVAVLVINNKEGE
jgi:phospholipid N-methyltransferase